MIDRPNTFSNDGEPSVLACLADIHGNTAALDAVLESEEFAGVEAVAFLGCITTGPDPLGVLQRCHALRMPTVFVAGNGERAVIETADGRRTDDWALGGWLAERHGTFGLDVIRQWPVSTTCVVPGLGATRLCHGSPRSDIECLTPRTDASRIREAFAGIAEKVVVHGHTHLQYDRAVAGFRIIGPGSVGLPYTSGTFGAQWAILGPDARLLTTPYDLNEATRRVQATGYPEERFLDTLVRPPSPEEIIADSESKMFSD